MSTPEVAQLVSLEDIEGALVDANQGTTRRHKTCCRILVLLNRDASTVIYAPNACSRDHFDQVDCRHHFD